MKKLYRFHGTDSTISDESGELRLTTGQIVELDSVRAELHIGNGLPITEETAPAVPDQE